MNNLLIFFAIPFAVVIISIALQKLLRCPYLVASIILSIFLIIGFALSNTTYLIAGIVYTILSFVTAYITMLVHRYKNRNNTFSNINLNNNGVSNMNPNGNYMNTATTLNTLTNETTNCGYNRI